jgi:hypothetical protein
MRLTATIIITLAIIFGIALGTGLLTFGIMLALDFKDEPAGIIATGSAILSASSAALIAHLVRSFSDLDDVEP